MIIGSCLFGGSWLGGYAAGSTVIAGAIHCGVVIHHGRVVRIIDDRGVYVRDRRVVVVDFAAPFTTAKSDVRPPISRVPDLNASAPTPITRGPQIPRRRSQDPGSRHPEISVVTVGSIARGPDIACAGAYGLRVNGQGGRSDMNTYLDRHLRGGRSGHCQGGQNKQR
jgi:hypothetical protein